MSFRPEDTLSITGDTLSITEDTLSITGETGAIRASTSPMYLENKRQFYNGRLFSFFTAFAESYLALARSPSDVNSTPT